MSGCFFLAGLIATAGLSAQTVPDSSVDVLNYDFSIALSDSNNLIRGKAVLTVGFDREASSLKLDLVAKDPESGTGMLVGRVLWQQQAIPFIQSEKQLTLYSGDAPGFQQGIHQFTIFYEGEPADGLIISSNRHGARTFFGDNWPNRARHWLPCRDHPSDKATVTFRVSAPENYEVVANGLYEGMAGIRPGYREHVWRERHPIPTKVMVIGVADFAWETAGYVDEMAVQSWIYNDDQHLGFVDYAPAVDIVAWFSRLIAPFPYEKLANVQSKTIYGGMENASCIFYHERSVNGKNQQHGLLAHEIAHQWFGNAISETDWPHLWISEGFATYLEAVYSSYRDTAHPLGERMSSARKSVVTYARRNFKPVVDSTAADPMSLLNTNSYQKGAWFLHMLREEVGDDRFWIIIRDFYQQYAHGNAGTEEFRMVAEKHSGRDLHPFFDQWLKRAGHPQLKLYYSFDKATGTLLIEVDQTQEGKPYNFTLEIGILDQKGHIAQTVELSCSSKHTSLRVAPGFTPGGYLADPRVKLLFEETDGR